ncbi:unnamed protein product [Cyprideis torosa]|uniref:Uncharacterized protein n=1 Tax=Cyprideis torosa TaxID=163714 RepID=A0A7R8WH54_9CRUS|nr:unnamed protein product [Cyprideis torosa]CAG0898979.1 unnamed protein product [Cyprideis torosa]
MQKMTTKISVKIVLVCLWIPGLLSLELTKYETFQKFEGLECNTITGQTISGLSLTRCLAKAVKNQCWSVQTIPACECCDSIKTNGPSFVYAPAGCPSGWDLNFENLKCYFFSTDKMNWSAAENHCGSLEQGAQLASIHSQTEMNYLLNRTKGFYTWVGGTDSAEEGNWMWNDGTPFDFEVWYPDEPNAGTAANCMDIYSYGVDAGMDDAFCTYLFKFICMTDAA